MDLETSLRTLRERVGSELHTGREAGRQELADILGATETLSADEALARVDHLESAGRIEYVAAPTPPPDAMLEAARYGTFPPADPNGGYWRIGSA